jgi:ABC-type multidrug transport system fused ATPase/permease subunit
VVLAGNALVFWSLAEAVLDGRIGLGAATTYLQAAVGASAVAFGGLSWALDTAAAPAAATLRLPAQMAAAGALAPGADRPHPLGTTAPEVRFRGVTFGYGSDQPPVLAGVDLTVPAGTSMAVVGVNGAGKTTMAKLLCRLYDPQQGAIEVDGVDIRDLDLADFRQTVTAVFQDFVRYELPLRDNVAPMGADDALVTAALVAAGAEGLVGLDTVLARGYQDGTDLSGGQWQRVALARALAPYGREPGWCSSTSPPPPSTSAARRRSSTGSSPRPAAAPRSWCRTGSPPSQGRPHLRARARPGGRARHARGADGARRPLPHDVRPAGLPVHRVRRAGGGGRP